MRKKRDTRASAKVSDLKGEDDNASGTTGVPFVPVAGGGVGSLENM